MISGVKVNGFHLLLYSIALRTLSLSPLHFVQLDDLHSFLYYLYDSFVLNILAIA